MISVLNLNNINNYKQTADFKEEKPAIISKEQELHLKKPDFNNYKAAFGSKISFRGGVNLSPFEAEGQKIIREILDKCSYGYNLEAFIKQNNFRAFSREDGVSLLNCSSTKELDGKTIKGLCYELTSKVGEKLSEIFEEEYKFVELWGYSQRFQFKHSVLGCWKKSETEKITRELKDLYEKNSKAPVLFEDFPKDCLFIDPSFKITGQGNIEEFKNCYITRIRGLEAFNPFKNNTSDFKYISPYSTNEFPVGMVKDLLPQKQKDFEADSILFMSFLRKNPSAPPEIKLSVTRPYSRRSHEVKDIENILTSDQPLNIFLTKIKQDLQEKINQEPNTLNSIYTR